MSAGSGGALVCGFFDLAAGLAGIAWRLEEPGGLLLSDERVEVAESEISERDGAVEIAMASPRGKVEAALAPRVPPIRPTGPDGAVPPGGELEVALCSATVRGQADRSIRCPGHLSRWQENPGGGAGTLRHLAIEAPEGALLLVVSVGGPGAPHGEEEACGWLLGSEGGASAFEEALLSTQYDEAGRQTRIGLELWPQGTDQATRAAATRGAGTALGTETAGAVSAALLRCSVEGTDGLGSYLIRRGSK